MEVEKKVKQLSMHIPLEIHTLVKVAASLRNLTIGKWIMRAIEKQLAEEKYE